MSLSTLLLQPFQFDFMNNALLIAVLLAIPAALISCLLVLKGWALLGDAMSHAVFPGVVLAYMAGLPFAVGAFFSGLFCALATGFLKENTRIKQDALMGIVFSAMFAIGLILSVSVKAEIHLDHILFGDMLGINASDLIQTGLIALLIVLIFVVKWRDFLLHAFDPVQASASGLNTSLLHYGLLCMTALTIVAALKAVGIILTISLLIAPGAIALLLTRTFYNMMLVAILLSVTVTFSGVYLSFFIDSAPAPTIVVLFSLVFIVVFARISIKDRFKHSRQPKNPASPT